MDGEKMQDLKTAISLLAMSQWGKRSSLAPAVAFGGAALYLYVNLFASPRVPYLIGGDQSFFWVHAMRMLDGARIYVDFREFTPPGTDLLFLSLFRAFGLRMWVTNIVVLGLGLALAWIVFSIARKFARLESSMLAAAVFLVPIYGKALNATHHWFGTLAVLGAVRVVLTGRTTWRIALAGAILGLASFFSLYHGLAGLVAFWAFLLWESVHTQPRWAGVLRGQAVLFASYIVAMFLLYSHYLLMGIRIGQIWYSQVTYVREFAIDAYKGVELIIPRPITLHNLPVLSDYFIVYLLLTAATGGAAYFCWRRRKAGGSSESALLLVLVAVLLFAEVAVSPNWLRIYAVSAPAVILLAWVIDELPKGRVCVSLVLWCWILVLGTHQTLSHHRMQREVIDLPAGRVATTQQMAAKLSLVSQFVKPGDAVFQAAWPGVYLPLHVRIPLPVDSVGLASLRGPGDIPFVVQQLEEQRVPYVLWATQLDASCSSPCIDRLTPLRNYVRAEYAPVATTPDGDTLWRRHP